MINLFGTGSGKDCGSDDGYTPEEHAYWVGYEDGKKGHNTAMSMADEQVDYLEVALVKLGELKEKHETTISKTVAKELKEKIRGGVLFIREECLQEHLARVVDDLTEKN